MKQLDRATKFTLEYMQILQDSLHFEYHEKGVPFVDTSQTNIATLNVLKSRVTGLLTSSSMHDAITDSCHYGKQSVQTVGFGLVPFQQFDEFVKMGFLLGARLVLWDLIGTRLLGTITDNRVQIDAITEAARPVLSLKSIAEQGGLVLLPHPADWSEKAQYQIAQLEESGLGYTTDYGLVATLSILEEIPLHPYTLPSSSSINWSRQPLFTDDEYYSKDHYNYHRVVNDMFEDIRFVYLRNTTVADFYKIVGKDMNFQIELKEFLSPMRGSLSPQEVIEHASNKRDKLVNLIEKRNKKITELLTEGFPAVISYVAASFILLGSPPADYPAVIGKSIMVLGPSLRSLLHQVFKKEDQNILVQRFNELAKTARPVS